MEDEQILENWRGEIRNELAQTHPRVPQFRASLRQELPDLSVWLGGPGRDSKYYHLRTLVKTILTEEKFEVTFSEDYKGGADISSKEIEEVLAGDITILIAMSPGSSAEAIEFAHLRRVAASLLVFIPIDYNKGYVYKSLKGNHFLIDEESSVFSLKNAEEYGPELALKIYRRAIAERTRLYAARQVKKSTKAE